MKTPHVTTRSLPIALLAGFSLFVCTAPARAQGVCDGSLQQSLTDP